MFKITSENELLESFRELERSEVHIPKDLQFPLFVKDYLAWVEPSGARAYLLFAEGTRPLPMGIVFRRGPSSPSAMMCEWCHSVRAGDEVRLLTATSNSNRRVGLHLCQDLSCKEKAHENPGVHDVPEALDGHQKVRRILGRMAEFSRRYLF